MENTTTIFEPPIVYATFWQRFAAAFIDGLILSIPTWLLNTYTTFASPFNIGAYYQLNILSIVLAWLYSALQESGPNQATIGKKALGLKVTGMNGERISFANATGRHFAKNISMIILFIGYLMMLWDDKRQTLHDKMAGTLVIKQ